jgi:hypothetical protein
MLRVMAEARVASRLVAHAMWIANVARTFASTESAAIRGAADFAKHAIERLPG